MAKIAKIPKDLVERFEFYKGLLGFNEALQLLVRRDKAATKLEKKKAKDRREGQAGSRPDGRLNGYNIALNSLVGRMGGKRKPKKSRRGF